MASIINASSTGSGGIVQTADASGVLQLQTNGTVAVYIDTTAAVGINTGTNVLGNKLEVVGSSRVSEVYAQNGYEVAPGSPTIITAYNRTTNTWLALRQRALQHEFYSNGTEVARISSSGYVTTPYQVSFNVYASASLSGAQTPVVFNTVRHNKGSGYSTSTGRFTAPVDGTYFFSVTNNMIQANGADGLIRKNGSNIIGVEYDAATAGVWLGLTATTILELVAGDYIDYITGAGSSFTVEGTPWNNFVGYLLG